MADISKIGTGLTSKIYSNQKKATGEQPKADVGTTQNNANSFQGISANDVLNSMALAGMQNKIQHGIRTIDPGKYLSQERINDIANSMMAFMGKTDEMKKSLDEEFGHLPEYQGLSEDKKFEMAAEAFARMDS